ncbi:BarH-like 1 homeobox protein [Homalodisca vitripennis]|nr:BarH-like 1 homeobox protein [Homalodisca vitripennis]
MTVHDMPPGVLSMPHHHPHLARSRFMITDILSGQSGQRSPPSPASSGDAPRDLSLHCRDAELSDGHESGTDSGLPGDASSVCSNGAREVGRKPRGVDRR